MNSDTDEQAVDAIYRVTGEHRSAYDRTTAEAHDVAPGLRDAGPAGRMASGAHGLRGAWLKPPLQTSMQAGPGPCAGQGSRPRGCFAPPATAQVRVARIAACE